jgi:hypothetical protein
MGLFSITTDVAGQVNVNPRRVKMISYDNYATISAAGYLSPELLGGFAVYPTDIFDVIYNYVAGSPSSGIYVELTPSFSNGVITLAPVSISLPVVSGDLASFSGTTGLLGDSGISAASVASAVASNANLVAVSVTLTAAQVLAAYATPIVLVPAVAGKAYISLSGQIYTNVSGTAFAGGGVAIVQYAATAHGAGTDFLAATIPAAEITAASSQIYTLAGLASTTVSTGITDEGIYFSNATGPFTGGAGSSLTITLVYLSLTATV